MALTRKLVTPKIAAAKARNTNTGANLLKAKARDELAVDLQEILAEQLKAGYESGFVTVDIAELCSRLGQLPASLKNTMRGFAAVVGPKGKVTVSYPRGDEAEAFLVKVNEWVAANPTAELRPIGGLALWTGATVNGVHRSIPDNEDVTIKPRKAKQLAQTVPRYYILGISNYWAGSNSSRASK